MRNRSRICLSLILFLFQLVSLPATVQAAFSPSSCSFYSANSNNVIQDAYVLGSQHDNNIVLNFVNLDSSKSYQIRMTRADGETRESRQVSPNNGNVTLQLEDLNDMSFLQDAGTNFSVKIELIEYIGIVAGKKPPVVCNLGTVSFTTTSFKCQFYVWNEYSTGEKCYGGTPPYCLSTEGTLQVQTEITNGEGAFANSFVYLNVTQGGNTKRIKSRVNSSETSIITLSNPSVGNLSISAELTVDAIKGTTDICEGSISLEISPSCKDSDGILQCSLVGKPLIPVVITPEDNAPFLICQQISDASLRLDCEDCAKKGEGGEANQGGIWTAIGCISRDPMEITERLIQVGLGMGGGVALIMTLAGGFILSTSQGDPQKANQAKEMITNSVIGLLFVIFSVFILQFIGVTILNIPGFGSSQ